MKTENMYYNQQKRSEVKEEARRLRRKFLRYQQAEIVYSLSHKKLMELANDAGAIYRMDGIVLINREIFDEFRIMEHLITGFWRIWSRRSMKMKSLRKNDFPITSIIMM